MSKSKKELYDLLRFQGYATLDLDVAAERYTNRFARLPKAFLVRSPYMITGQYEHKKLMVVSQKHGGYAAIYISTLLDAAGLISTFSQLGDVCQEEHVERRKVEDRFMKLDRAKEEQRKIYQRHCNYCATWYSTSTAVPVLYCSDPACRIRHNEYMAEIAQRRIKVRQKEKAAQGNIKISTPDFTLDNPTNYSLRGFVYFIEATNGYVKIGRSDDPNRRFGDIVNMSPIPLCLVHTIHSANCVLAESAIHDKLSKYRRHGEWFELPEDTLARCLELDNYDLDVIVDSQFSAPESRSFAETKTI